MSHSDLSLLCDWHIEFGIANPDDPRVGDQLVPDESQRYDIPVPVGRAMDLIVALIIGDHSIPGASILFVPGMEWSPIIREP